MGATTTFKRPCGGGGGPQRPDVRTLVEHQYYHKTHTIARAAWSAFGLYMMAALYGGAFLAPVAAELQQGLMGSAWLSKI